MESPCNMHRYSFSDQQLTLLYSIILLLLFSQLVSLFAELGTELFHHCVNKQRQTPWRSLLNRLLSTILSFPCTQWITSKGKKSTCYSNRHSISWINPHYFLLFGRESRPNLSNLPMRSGSFTISNMIVEQENWTEPRPLCDSTKPGSHQSQEIIAMKLSSGSELTLFAIVILLPMAIVQNVLELIHWEWTVNTAQNLVL